MNPARRSLSTRAQLALLLLLLGAIATLMSGGRPEARITISGLTLADDRNSILAKKGQPNFQEGRPFTHLEYWSDPVVVDPSLSLDFDQAGRLLRMQGGKPEINGENVRKWSLDQVERALGPAAGAAQSQAFSSGGSIVGGDSFLKYPDRHLLVTWNREAGTSFVLFAGTR